MRNSSVELFRIISTFLVLVVHFNGWFVGMPDKFLKFSVYTISQDIIESVSCICVNCFLVITGWYGMTFKWKHVWTIWSILECIYIPCYFLESYYTGHYSVRELLMSIIAIGKESYYVQCYMMLLFMSPILNSFIKKYGRRILPYTLSFWFIEITFDWILQNQCLGFGRGYELTHFILMYLLGQTAHLYKDEINKYYRSRYCIVVFFIGVILISLMYLYLPSTFCFVYSNPINIVLSFSLFFVFERRTIHNKTINWISKSTLTVYILHVTPPIINILRDWDNYVLQSYNYFGYIGIMAITIIIVFFAGILYDKVRLLFMPSLGEKVCDWISLKTQKYSLLSNG